jgi:hypothetical protein
MMQLLQPGKENDESKCADRKEPTKANRKIISLAVCAVIEKHPSHAAKQPGNEGECQGRERGQDESRAAGMVAVSVS